MKYRSRTVHCLVALKVPRLHDPGPLCPTSTISAAHHFLHDNSNSSTVVYSSRVPTSASSCPMLRHFDSNFASVRTDPLAYCHADHPLPSDTREGGHSSEEDLANRPQSSDARRAAWEGDKARQEGCNGSGGGRPSDERRHEARQICGRAMELIGRDATTAKKGDQATSIGTEGDGRSERERTILRELSYQSN
ncbi:hypothetical protein BHE74_00019432 [Ensete ventricosum]|nr:hypothetical protein BHE74_00019432 [Ensete ventricosum]